jgi:hypothetical protein
MITQRNRSSVLREWLTIRGFEDGLEVSDTDRKVPDPSVWESLLKERSEPQRATPLRSKRFWERQRKRQV